MKRLFLFPLMLVAASFVTIAINGCSKENTVAQKFTISGNDSVTGTAGLAPLLTETIITNNTNATLYLHWSKEILSGPTEWAMAFCDPNLCYPANIFEQAFELGANGTSNGSGAFHAQVVTADTRGGSSTPVPGTGTMRVKVWVEGDSVNTVQSTLQTITAN